MLITKSKVQNFTCFIFESLIKDKYQENFQEKRGKIFMLTNTKHFSPFISLINELCEFTELIELENIGCKIYYPENEIIIHFGEYVDGLYLLTKGTASARFLSPQGSEIVVFIMKPICIFGEAPFFNKSESNLEIEINSGSTVIFFDKNSVDYLLKKNSFLKELIIKSIMIKAQISIERLTDVYNLSPEQRVCKYLKYLCLECGIKISNNKYLLNITQEEMAYFVGLSRVTVARIYSNLRHYNIIDNSYKSKKKLTVNLDNLLKYLAKFH